MRLNEALGDEKICLCRELVNSESTARGKSADSHEAVLIGGNVNHDLLVINDLLAELCNELLASGVSVASGRDEYGNIGIGVAFSDFCEHRGNDDAAGHGTSVVARDEHDLVLAARKLGELRRAVGIRHSLANEGESVSLCGVSVY